MLNKMDVEISEYNGKGYSPVVDFEHWRVAFLNSADDVEAQNITYLQKHEETDEVFVLIEGECILFSAGEGACSGKICGIYMEQNKMYNVKKGVWHTHVLAPNTKVLIVENQDTGLENSPCQDIEPEQKQDIIAQCAQYRLT